MSARPSAPRADRPGRLVPVLVAMALATASVGCGASGTDRGALPTAPPSITVTMREYRFDHPTFVPSGRVVFRFVNAGAVLHQPDLIPLAEDLPPLDEQLHGENRQAVTQFAGVPPRKPGQVGTFAVDLVPGRRYGLICFATDPDGSSHALKGMNAEFRSGQATPPASRRSSSG